MTSTSVSRMPLLLRALMAASLAYFQRRRAEPGKFGAHAHAARGITQAGITSGRPQLAGAQAGTAVRAIIDQPQQRCDRIPERMAAAAGMLRAGAIGGLHRQAKWHRAQ